ncbi:T9SS type A sorting domain-containing protein [Flavobacterium ardleyense]|uniref:T9SS type A sorting domain-containing protein n=1 Tax=Flavobacterium ardleyense TaxID=2038737 RepID=UPI00298C26C3|nr:T9SS type A sorting domain-containing protein [Flavobacterium ardleyense]
MKKITLGLFVLCASFAVQAQDFSQTTSQDIVPETSVSCSDQTTGFASASTYYRAYDLPALGVTAPYGVTNISFGLEEVSGEVEVTVNLYATTANFPTGFTLVPGPQYNLIASTTVMVDETDSLGLVTVPFTSALVPVGSKLVIELAHDDLEEGFYLGGNSSGQSKPGYIAAEGCGIATPTTYTQVGFPNMHLVLNVSGTTDALALNNNTLEQVSVYPNPTSGLVQVNLPSSVEIISVTVSDISGKQMNASISGNTIDMSNFANGVYMVNVNTNEGNLVRKVVKN